MTQALNVVVDCLRERSVLFRINTDDHDGILSELRARGSGITRHCSMTRACPEVPWHCDDTHVSDFDERRLSYPYLSYLGSC